MTTANKSSVLKDVVAFVDVWSSEKTANYSESFVQQLQAMGAQVSKTLNKQVTHVVFNNGHSATWKKAKKSNAHLVSVLWIGSCYENGVQAAEELFPASNDERNPVLKNKRHRCMRPKDFPVKTPESDWRMRKKFEKMMKDLPPRQTVVTDVSSIIIDEENGIIYSPSLKRSEYMAQRLQDMKDKRENLSPTASQMADCGSPTALKPLLGSTPTFPTFMLNESDDESSVSLAELDHSPDKEEEGRTALHAQDSQHPDVKDSAKPWLSQCRDVPEQTFRSEGQEQDGKKRKSRRASVRKHSSAGLLENSSPDGRSSSVKNVPKQKSLSAVESEHSKCEFTKPRSADLHVGAVESPWRSSSSAAMDAAAANASKEAAAAAFQRSDAKTPRRAGLSLSALLKSFTPSSQPQSVGAAFDGEDEVFEDFFSPANSLQRPGKPLLPLEGSIHIPFELEPAVKKRKRRTSRSLRSESEDQRRRNPNSKHIKAFESSTEPGTPERQPACAAAPGGSRTGVTPAAQRRRRGSPVLEEAAETSSAPPAAAPEDSGKNVVSGSLHRRGNERTVAAAFTEGSAPAEKNENEQMDLSPERMGHSSKAMRTLVMTSMSTETRHTVVQVVEALGGFSIVDRVCESTTHLVCGADRRTLNVLLGIARGCWILSSDWILWCLEKRQWVPEEPFELSDKFPAAQICRLQRHLSAGEHQQDLFQGQPAMFVSRQSQPPTQSLVELIQLCGGTVCKTARRAGVFIGRHSGRRPEGSRVVSEQWVLDSITHLKRLSYDGYDLE